MRIRLFAAVAVVAGLAAYSPAFGQTAPGGGGGTSGGGTTPTGAGAGKVEADVDLPIGASAGTVEDEPPYNETPDTDLYNEHLPIQGHMIVYVIDVSGSMDWGYSSYTGLDGNPASGSRLDRAKVELIRSISGLDDSFSFNIYSYDCGIYQWSQSLQQVTPATKASACGWVGGLQALGATGTGPACVKALADNRENKTLVLLSDGAPNCIGNYYGDIPEHRAMIRAGNTQAAVILTFGIAAYGEFEQFLRDVATDSGGQYYPVP